MSLYQLLYALIHLHKRNISTDSFSHHSLPNVANLSTVYCFTNAVGSPSPVIVEYLPSYEKRKIHTLISM